MYVFVCIYAFICVCMCTHMCAGMLCMDLYIERPEKLCLIYRLFQLASLSQKILSLPECWDYRQTIKPPDFYVGIGTQTPAPTPALDMTYPLIHIPIPFNFMIIKT